MRGGCARNKLAGRIGRSGNAGGTSGCSILSRLVLLLHPDHGDLGESFLEAGSAEFGSHALHDVVSYYPLTLAIAFQADFEWNVEINSVNFVAVIAGHLDPGVAVMLGEVGGVYVVGGPARD